MSAILNTIPTEVQVAPPSAMLRVFRDSEFDIGYREAIILLDGKEVANVAYRKWAEIEIEPGAHTLQAYNRVFKSEKITFDIKAGERRTFQTGNVGGGCFLFLAIMFQLGIPRVFLRMETPDPIQDGSFAIPDGWRLG